MDRRVAAGVGTLAGEPEERSDHLQRRLRDRLFEVAAGGGDRAADGHGAFLAGA